MSISNGELGRPSTLEDISCIVMLAPDVKLVLTRPIEEAPTVDDIDKAEPDSPLSELYADFDDAPGRIVSQTQFENVKRPPLNHRRHDSYA